MFSSSLSLSLSCLVGQIRELAAPWTRRGGGEILMTATVTKRRQQEGKKTNKSASQQPFPEVGITGRIPRCEIFL